MIKIFLFLLVFFMFSNLFAFYVIAIRIDLPFVRAFRDFFWTANYWRVFWVDILQSIAGAYILYEQNWVLFFCLIVFFNIYLFPKQLRYILKIKEYHFFEENFKKDLEETK